MKIIAIILLLGISFPFDVEDEVRFERKYNQIFIRVEKKKMMI